MAHTGIVDTGEARGIGRPDPERPEELDGGDPPGLTVPATMRRRLSEAGMGVLWALYAFLNVFPPSHEHFAPWLVIPVCLLSSAHFLARAFDRRPRFTMDPAGLLDRTSIAGGQLQIPWRDILSVTASRWRGTVEVEVRDFEELCRNAGLRRRMALRLGALFGKRTVSVRPTLLGLSREHLRERLDAELLRFERSSLGLGPEPAQLPMQTTE